MSETVTYWAGDSPFPDPEEPARIEWYPLHTTRAKAQAESDQWYDGFVYEIRVIRHERNEVEPIPEWAEKAVAASRDNPNPFHDLELEQDCAVYAPAPRPATAPR